jgi:FkbM family methyltransferase
VSYSQAGEDLVLDFLVNYKPRGVYVDVGCNHPIKVSNTYRFYRKGWSGIAVDANVKFADLFRRHRRRDCFIRACVSDREETVAFHHFAADDLSSISGARLFDDDARYALERIEKIKTRTLTDILSDARCPPVFDILSVDVEGHDEAVLRSLDFARFRAAVIVVELNGTDLDLGRIEQHPVAQLLSNNGYDVVAAHWGNVFFRLNGVRTWETPRATPAFAAAEENFPC